MDKINIRNLQAWRGCLTDRKGLRHIHIDDGRTWKTTMSSIGDPGGPGVANQRGPGSIEALDSRGKACGQQRMA